MQFKKIAIFIDSLGGGGAEKVMLILARSLRAQGHYVHFFLLEPRVEYQSEDVPFNVLYNDVSHRLSTARRNIKATAKDMEKLINEVSSNVGPFDLHLVNLDPSSQIINHCSLNNVYYILHNAMVQEIKREAKVGPHKFIRKLLEKRVYNGKDVIAVSKGVALEASNNLIFSPKSIKAIYNPTDIDFVQSQSLSALPEIPTEPYIIHAGRVVKQKRHDLLFRALSRVPHIKLVLLCSKTDKALNLAKKYKVADRVILPGFQQNPYPWLKHAKALVSSSDFEGLGMNLIDAMLCGTPVVSTNCDYGPSEILTGEQARFLVPVGDHIALAEAINEVLVRPPKIDESHLIKQFSMTTVAKQYIKLCK